MLKNPAVHPIQCDGLDFKALPTQSLRIITMAVHLRYPRNTLIGLLGVLALLAGCETLIQETPRGRWIEIAPGSTLRLHQPIRIPEGRARVWLVNGRLSRNSANYRTSCALEVRRLARDGPQTMPAGAIRITRIQNYWTEVAAAMPPVSGDIGLRLASYGDSGDSGYSMIRTGYHFWLDDSVNPNLRRLTCLGVLADPPEADPPSLAEIDAALGGLATIEVSSAEPR